MEAGAPPCTELGDTDMDIQLYRVFQPISDIQGTSHL